MADISKIQLPNNIVYDIKDANAAKIGVVEYGVSTYQEVLEAYENNNEVICIVTDRQDMAGYVIKNTALLCSYSNSNDYITFNFYGYDVSRSGYYFHISIDSVAKSWSLTEERIGKVTSVGIGSITDGGLSISGSPITSYGTISIGHSNVLSSAQTTSGIYPIKIDKNGHISEYGSAVTIPTKVSDLTNDSGFITGYTETDPTVPSWAKAANKPSYNAEEIALDSPWTYDGNVISTAEEALNYLDDNKLSSETDPVFTASAAYGISSSDITNWNSKTSNVGTITSVKTTAGAHSTIDVSSGAVTFNVPTTAAHVGAVADCTLQIYNGQGGNPGVVKFLTVDYSTCGSENGVLIKVTMMAGHGNGSSYNHYQDAIISVNYQGAVSVNIYRYYAASVTYSSETHYYGDILYTIDTTNKIVKFYDLMGQYSYMKQSPFKRMNGSSGGVITQHTSASYDLSGTGTFANVFWMDGSNKQDTLVSGTNIKTINSNSILGSGNVDVGTVTSVRVQATSPVASSTSTAQSSTLNTTISLADAYGDTKNPYGTKTANYILAGPSSGSAAAPSFRALVAADIPDLSSTYQTKLASTTASLTTAGWSSNAQTVSVSGVTASNTVIVAPAPSSLEDYTAAGIYCSAQASGTLTFTCKTVPSSAITVNVLIT